MGNEKKKEKKKSTTSLTVAKATESTPQEGENMTATATMTTKEAKAKFKAELEAIKIQEKVEREAAKAKRKADREAKAAAKAAGISPIFSRVDSITDFVSKNKSFTLDEIAKGSNATYAAERNNQKADNERESKAINRWILKALVNVEYLKLVEGVYSKK
jgi:colicin import membrane protein